MLLVAIGATVLVLVAFVFTTLVEEPGTVAALGLILVLSVALDWWWKRARGPRVTADVAEGSTLPG